MIQQRSRRRTINGKRAALLLVALAGIGGTVYGANRVMIRRNAEAMLHQARKADQEDNTPEAVKLYLDYLNFQPRDADALASYAAMLERRGSNRPKAILERADTYKRLLKVDPTRREEQQKLVKIYLGMQSYADAKDHIEYLLDPAQGGTPDDPELLTQLAVCEVGTGRPAEAIEHLRHAIGGKRAGTEAYILLARLLRDEIKTREALDESDQVLGQLTQDKPGDTAARLARCRYLLSVGRKTEARTELEAVKGGPAGGEGNAELAQLLAELHLADDKVTQARDVLTKAATANPNDAQVRLMLSDVYRRLNDPPRAKQELEKATALLPDDGPALLDAIDRKIDYGMLPEAKRDVRRFADREEYQPAADYLTGRLLLAEGNWPAARVRLDKAVGAFERLPRFLAKAYIALAGCYRAANNPDQMLAMAAAAAKTDPLSPAARLAVAEANAFLGHWTEAVPVYKQYAAGVPEARSAYVRLTFAEQAARPAAARDWSAFDLAVGSPPYTSDVVLLKARSLAARGDRPAALAVLRDAVRQRPDDPDIRTTLALIAGLSDPAAGLAVLDQAEREVGDKAVFRLAKAQLLATDPVEADYPTIAALGENAAGFRAGDRFALFAGLGDLAAGRLKKPAEAVDWYLRAAAEEPYNLPSRMALFHAAVAAKRPADADRALSEIRALDTPDGPTFLVYDALRQLPTLRAGGRETLPAVRAEVVRAMRTRESWPQAHALLGELDDLADDGEAALEHYRRAFDLGERSDPLVRRMVQLLCQRARFVDARRVLDTRGRTAALPTDLRRQQALVETALGGDPTTSSDLVRGTETSKDPLDHLFRGQSLLLGGDRVGAARAFEAAVNLDPGLVEGWVDLVRVYAVSGNTADARAAAARAERALAGATTKPKNPAAVPTALGDIHVLFGANREAEGLYRKALTVAPADPTATQRLVELYTRLGRPADAVPLLRAVLGGPGREAVKRWARRALADALVAQPGGFARLGEAVALVEENLKAGDHPEDERAKAFLIAVDPYRRPEARQLLADSARNGPFTPDENVAFARLFIDAGELASAENLLVDATRLTALANPEHLVLLHRVQLTRGRLPQARETLDRLKALRPGDWETTAEEVRHLARDDRTAAARVALEAPGAVDPAAQLTRVAPLLTEVGCHDAAERLLTRLVDTTRLPNRHLVLARAYIAAGKPEKAVDLANRFDPKEYPTTVKAQVLSGAVATRSLAATAPADRAGWARTLGEIAAWVTEQLRAAPGEPVLRQCEAVVADAQGRYEDAIRSYEKLIEIAPTAVGARKELAFLLAVVKKDTSERPLELIDAAIKVDGPKPFLLDARGVIHLAADRQAEAVRDLGAAVLTRQDPTFYFHQALAFEKAGDIGRKIGAIDTARNLKLKKTALHPAEWSEYERLFGPE